mgnify:FL=1
MWVIVPFRYYDHTMSAYHINMQNTFILLILLSVIFAGLKLFQNAGNKKNLHPTIIVGTKDNILARHNTDVYRGWAIIIIMLCHVAGSFSCVFFTPLGGIGVAIFLLLSGYGLNESYKKSGLKGFWRKKLLRVALPYVLFRLLWMMIHGTIMDWHVWWSIVNCGGTSFWYIDYLVHCYIAFWIANGICKGKYKLIMLSLFAVYSFTLLCAEQALSFYLGVLLSEKMQITDKLNNKRLYAVLAILAAVGIGCLAIKQLPMIRELGDTMWYSLCELGIKLPLGISFMIALYLTKRIVASELIVMMGAVSLELYLIHIWLVNIIVKDNAWQGLALFVVSTLLAYSYNKMCSRMFKLVELN